MNRVQVWAIYYRNTLLGVLLGMFIGYAYYALIGCNSGSCAITSNPLNSVLYGALMGGLVVGIPREETNKKQINHER